MSESIPEQSITESTPYVSNIPDGKAISVGVIDAVEAVSGRSSLGGRSRTDEDGGKPLSPLYEVIDPDALDSLCLPKTDDVQTATTVSFFYEGYHITVESTGQIAVEEN